MKKSINYTKSHWNYDQKRLLCQQPKRRFELEYNLIKNLN
jgi:hypothetical protein